MVNTGVTADCADAPRSDGESRAEFHQLALSTIDGKINVAIGANDAGAEGCTVYENRANDSKRQHPCPAKLGGCIPVPKISCGDTDTPAARTQGNAGDGR